MESFSIAPAETRAMWVLPVVLVLILVPVIALVAVSLRGARPHGLTFPRPACICEAICTAG